MLMMKYIVMMLLQILGAKQPQCLLLAAALDDKLYVTGGLGLTDKSPNSWDIYNKGTGSWYAHKNPMLTPNIVKFVALDNELVTIHKAAWNRMYFAGIYNLVNQTWRGTANEIALCWSGPMVVMDDGTLYMLDQSLGTKLMMWLKDTKEWVMLRKIYIMGRGLSTVTIDVDMAARVDGFLHRWVR